MINNFEPQFWWAHYNGLYDVHVEVDPDGERLIVGGRHSDYWRWGDWVVGWPQFGHTPPWRNSDILPLPPRERREHRGV